MGGPQQPMGYRPPGLPLAAPPQAGQPGLDPFSPLPQGQQGGFYTRQLQALELEEIPSHYKIERKESRWALRAVLAVLCVAAGVGIGLLAFRSDSSPVTATLEIESSPAGASVKVDGVALPEPTPTTYAEVEAGKTYTVEYSLAAYQPRTRKVEVPASGGEHRSFVFLERSKVKLSIESEPRGAEVLINGRVVGKTPLTLSELDPEKNRKLQIRAEGFKVKNVDLDWTGKTELKISETLAK
jgi:hypothetical protein